MADAKLAEAYVEISTRQGPLDKGLDSARGKLAAWSHSIKSMSAVPLVIAGGVAGGLAAQEFFRATQAASDLAETQNKVKEVFRESAGVVTRAAQDWADKYGLVKKVSLDAAAGLGLVAQAAGMSQGESAKLSLTLAKLAADASSFYNIPFADALEKVRSGLVGEAEPMRALGVLLDEESVKLEALRLGLVRNAKEVDQRAKVLARASLIEKGMATAAGDLDRTLDSLSNQQRKALGDIENFRAEIGESLIPVMADAVKLFNELFAGAGEGAKSGVAAAGEWAQAWINAFRMINQDGKVFVQSALEHFLDKDFVDYLFGESLDTKANRALGNKSSQGPLKPPQKGPTPEELKAEAIAAERADAAAEAAARRGERMFLERRMAAGLTFGNVGDIMGTAQAVGQGTLRNLMRRTNADAIGLEKWFQGIANREPMPFQSQTFGNIQSAVGSMQSDILNQKGETERRQLEALQDIARKANDQLEELRKIANKGFAQGLAILRGKD